MDFVKSIQCLQTNLSMSVHIVTQVYVQIQIDPLCWMFLGPAIWINGFANFGYISVSTIDLLGPGQHW